jgi:hypothetical protein
MGATPYGPQTLPLAYPELLNAALTHPPPDLIGVDAIGHRDGSN